MNAFPTLPQCPSCGTGSLLPLSDYGPDGSMVLYKAWACSKSSCGFVIRADKGTVTYGKARERTGGGRP